jgi:hypothetical protein
MKRIVAGAFGVLLVTALFSLTGCDRGGIEPGMPDNTTTPDAPLLPADMASGATPPPNIAGKKARTGTESSAPVKAEKEKEKDGTKK